MSINAWDEIRTAYHVARMGTVSGAAEALGVHHATVIRHVDALEGRLGVKLFQRHARGYTATEAGADLLVVAQATEDQFAQLAGRLKGQGDTVSGELVVTALSHFSKLLTPELVAFQAQHPGLHVRLLSDMRVYRLEYGEAHVAIRAGAAPDEPDNVVQPFLNENYALYASPGYIERRGMPQTDEALMSHDFIGVDSSVGKAPFYRWMNATIPADRILFRANDDRVLRDALVAGAGLGFLSEIKARDYPDLVQVRSAREEWSVPLWLVTHVDLHRTTKVQAFLDHIKRAAARWYSEH
ncbi:LysR family transcriptional regulator [Profundibacterium mesophilum]